MIENLPNWINISFVLIAIIAIMFFYFSNGKSKYVTLLIILWSILQSLLAYNGFYQNFDAVPPRFGLVLLPLTIIFIYAFFPKQIKWVLKNRNTQLSTFLHTIRVPVEIILLNLFLQKMVPELMTFEGLNFDILIGITAPIIGILYCKDRISKKGLLIWNCIGVILVSFILVNGLLSVELPIQQFGFEQPNRAVIYFPFILLPAMIVPMVIYTHITDIIKLSRELKLERN